MVLGRPLQYSIGNGYQSSADFVLNAGTCTNCMYKMQMAVRYKESYTLLPQLLDATLTQDLT
jgi:hypothetical protein